MTAITDAAGAETPRATRKEWTGLAVLALPTLLLALDLSVLYLALPHLTADLQPSSTQLLWITDVYGFLIAGFLITMGSLGDRVGRRRLLLIGATCFAAASVLAAYAPSAELLIAARALLGVSGATLMPSTLSLITNMFRDDKQRSQAIAVWMTAFIAGMAIGPVIGGVLLNWFWWGSVFLLGVPVMVLLLVTGPVLLPEYRNQSGGHVDLASVALSLGAIIGVVYAVKELAHHGWAAGPLLALPAGLALGVLFVRRQRHLEHPLLDLALFRIRALSAALLVMVVTCVSMGGLFLFSSQWLQLVHGMSPLAAGLWGLPGVAAVMVSTMTAPVVLHRIGPARLLGVSLSVAAVGCLVFTQVDAVGGLAVLIVGWVVLSVGMGPQGMVCTDLVVGSAPPEKAGSASAMSETSGELGIALGVALLGTVGTAVYRATMTDAVPATVAPEVGVAVRDTLAGATVATQGLPADVGAPLLATAREAFTTGMHVVAFGAAVTLLLLAVAAWRLLPRQMPGHGDAAVVPSSTVDLTDEVVYDGEVVPRPLSGEPEPAEA